MQAGARAGLGHDVVAGALVAGEATPGTGTAYVDPLGPVLARAALGDGPALIVHLGLVIGRRETAPCGMACTALSLRAPRPAPLA